MAVVTACMTVGVMGNSNVECTSLLSQCFIKKIVQGDKIVVWESKGKA